MFLLFIELLQNVKISFEQKRKKQQYHSLYPKHYNNIKMLHISYTKNKFQHYAFTIFNKNRKMHFTALFNITTIL